MRTPQHIADRSASWRDVMAAWLVAAVIFGVIGVSHAVTLLQKQEQLAGAQPAVQLAARASGKTP